MTKKILLPIDTSQRDAAGTAVQFARDNLNLDDVTFVLLNVLPQIPVYITAEVPEAVFSRGREEAAAALKAFADEVGLGASVETMVREGHPGREILDVADAVDADLILMSSHDPGFADYFLGSVAAYVVRHAHHSVVIVRNR